LKKNIDPDFNQKCSLFGFLNICQTFIRIKNGIINILDVLLRTGLTILELDELKYFILMFNFAPALNKTSLFSMGHCNYIKKNRGYNEV